MTLFCATVFILPSHAANDRTPTAAPLKTLSYTHPPSSAEIHEFLGELAESTPNAYLTEIGRSAGNRPLSALSISDDPGFLRLRQSHPDKVMMLIVAGQHGNESSGTEAVLRIAIELAKGDLRHYLRDMDFILVPNANPDGRDADRRVNANGTNINSDYVLLSQPESRALAGVLQRYEPHVVLDIHEASVLKRKTLGAQGFITDFEAQFEAATHQNIDPALRAFTYERFLPELIANVKGRGLAAQRYFSAINNINQTITHGWIWLRNLRNYASLRGALSVLIENRLDPEGDYPTPGNMEVRTKKQRLGINAFLEQCLKYRKTILELTNAARGDLDHRSKIPVVHLSGAYAIDPKQPRIKLPLRRRYNAESVKRNFDYHSRLVVSEPLSVPSAYAVTEHGQRIAKLLERHGIGYEHVTAPSRVVGVRQRIESIRRKPKDKNRNKLEIRITERCEEIRLRPGDLRLDLDPNHARLAALILDPRSSNSVFQSPGYTKLLVEGRDFFVARLSECTNEA